MSKQRRRYDDDDDDILRDGEVLRVRMTDSVSDAWQAEAKAQLNSTVQTVTDGGGGSGLGLFRPGFRLIGGGNKGDALVRDGLRKLRDDAYRARDEEVSNAYKNNPPPGESSRGNEFGRADQEGSPCTRNGWPGVLRRNADGELYCDIGRRDAAPPPETGDYELTAPERAVRNKESRNKKKGNSDVTVPKQDTKQTCPDCDGSGDDPDDNDRDCETCNGSGEIDARTVDQVQAAHRRTMDKLYRERDLQISQQWSVGKRKPQVINKQSNDGIDQREAEYSRYNDFIANQWRERL